jgi:hypothetical protein
MINSDIVGRISEVFDSENVFGEERARRRYVERVIHQHPESIGDSQLIKSWMNDPFHCTMPD